MKKKILMAGLILAVTLSVSTQVHAEETEEANKTVVLNEKNKITYTDGENEIADAFRDMAPGDEKTVVLRIENDSNHSASFFISQETTKALEDAAKATGGAYSYQLSVGNSRADAESLLDTIAGGYKENKKSRAAGLVGDASGLAGITELNNYVFLAELGKGDYVNVYLTLAIDGEGFDSTNLINYSNAAGELAFNFRAYYEDRAPRVVYGEDKVITKIVDQAVPLAAKTGDNWNMLPVIGLLAVGTLLIVFALKKRKVESES